MKTFKFKLLTQTALETLVTNAVTFGELKAEIKSNPSLAGKINFSSSQLIERNTKVSYKDIDEAILPSTDAIFFVNPVKTKSGSVGIEEVRDMGYNQLRTLGSSLNKEHNAGIDLSGKAAEISDRICAWLESQVEEEEEGTSKEEVQELVEQLVATAQLLSEKVANLRFSEEALAVKVTLAELEEEAQNLAKRLR